MVRKRTISVKDTAISIIEYQNSDYISLTDMIKAKDGDFFISDWLRNRNTVEYIGIWETINNPLFNYGEFAIIKSKAGLHNYKISVSEWVEKTNAIGLKATAGRYGGTYAHKDIAFEFGMWISPEFKIYLIKEFQRLKEIESNRLKLEWNLQRTLTKINYRIHTDAIRENLIPPEVSRKQMNLTYAPCSTPHASSQESTSVPDFSSSFADLWNMEYFFKSGQYLFSLFPGFRISFVFMKNL